MTRERLDEILRLHDDDGVISIYVSLDPAADPTMRPGWRIRIAAGLSALVDSAPDDRLRAVLTRRLDQLRGPLGNLLDPTGPGRGRALFAPLSSTQVYAVAVQGDWTDSVDLAPIPHVIPLLHAWTLGAPAGVAIVSPHQIRLVDITFGVAHDVDVLALQDDQRGDRRELVGPGASKTGRFQHSNRQTDLFTRREAAHLSPQLRKAGAWIAATAARSGWEDLLVAGEPEHATAILDGLPAGHAFTLIRVPHVLEHVRGRQVARVIAGDLATARRGRATRLAEGTRDLALAGGPAAYGPAEVLTALADGRVAHLVLDADHHWRGRRAPDGRLMLEGEAPPGTIEEDLVDEPLLADQIVLAAVRAGAQVTVLDALAALGPADGVAAILRW